MSTVAAYLRRNLLGLAGLLVGVGGIVIGYHLYRQAREERDPIFAVDPNRVEIVSAGRVATAPIRVLRRDGRPIQADIYAVRFFLWNAGKRLIRPENVLDTIRIALDSGSEILDFRTLKVSRPITRARLAADPPGPGLRKLAVTFSILEQDDGLAGQIIYQGSGTAGLRIAGIIEGVPKGIREGASPSLADVLRYSAIPALVNFALVVASYMWGRWEGKRRRLRIAAASMGPSAIRNRAIRNSGSRGGGI